MREIPLVEARDAWRAALDGLAVAVDGLSERDLLGPTRCHGWAVVDLLAHLTAGLQEMLHGVTAPVDAPPDVDAASYWEDYPPADPDDPESLAAVLAGRRRGSVPARPESVRRELRVVVAAVRRATDALDDRPRLFQDRVLTAGDFLAVWVVEVVIHHLDLDPDGTAAPPPPAGLALTREVVAARARSALPADDDLRIVLAGAGRTPVPPEWATAGLPVLG